MEVPFVSLGTCTFGSQVSEERAFEILDHAVDVHGITFIDTAEGYPTVMRWETHGETERLLGRWLKTRDDRDRLFINTKVYGTDFDKGGVLATHAPDEVREALDGSLERLGVAYVDMYMFHTPDLNTKNIPYTLTAIRDALKEGKIRSWALSNCSYEMWEVYCNAADHIGIPHPVLAQNRFNPLVDRSGHLQCPIPLMAYGVLNYGAFSGKYMHGEFPEGSRIRWLLDTGVIENTDAVVDDPNTHTWYTRCVLEGNNPLHAAIDWVAKQVDVKNICLGVTTKEQLDELMEAPSLKGRL